MRFLAKSILASAVVLVAASAHAQTQQGFAINRFEPGERGTEWFSLDSLDFRGRARPAFGATLDWSFKPLVAYAADGSERAAIVREQMFAHVGGAMVLWERLRLGLNLPIALTQSGEAARIGGVTYTPASKTSVGDLRIGLDLRLLGQYGDPFTVALGAWVFAPTGDREQYTSDGKLRIQPHVIAAGDIAAFAYSVRVGANWRQLKERFDRSHIGTELAFAVGAGLRLADKKLLIGPELWGTTVLEEGATFKRRGTPVELIFGAHYTAGSFRFGVGGGPGLSRGYGAPQFRLLASLEFIPAIEEKIAPPPPPPPPPEKPKDTDGDGIPDAQDACPTVAGVENPDPKKNGCPPDKDNDGITDAEDACIDVAGVKHEDPKKNGCPPDKDDDGIPDVDDACPDIAGVKSDDPKKNGCPPDKDGDGVIDSADACPDTPGPKDPDPKKNGCPPVAIVGKQIKITEQVKFKTGSAVIEKESDAILQGIAKVLKEHPEILKVRVEGHTDNKGNKALNKNLSKARAQSVVNWLVKNGIDKKRLFAEGYGEEKPIDDNGTEEGRQNNRRVELHIVQEAEPKEGGGAAAPAPTAEPAPPGAAPAAPAKK